MWLVLLRGWLRVCWCFCDICNQSVGSCVSETLISSNYSHINGSVAGHWPAVCSFLNYNKIYYSHMRRWLLRCISATFHPSSYLHTLFRTSHLIQFYYYYKILIFHYFGWHNSACLVLLQKNFLFKLHKLLNKINFKMNYIIKIGVIHFYLVFINILK